MGSPDVGIGDAKFVTGFDGATGEETTAKRRDVEEHVHVWRTAIEI